MRIRLGTTPRPRRQKGTRGVGLLCAVLALLWLLPVVALAAPAGQQAPTATAAGQPPPPDVASPTPPLPLVQPTATSTRPAKPVTGLVLVPYAVRPLTEAGTPPDAVLVRGRVLEASGRGLWGQMVKVSRPGFATTATTGDDGSYQVGGLEPGTYTVTVEQQITTPAENVKLERGKPMVVDFVQIRVAPLATPTGSGGPTATATATRTPTKTPRPEATATPTRSPTPTPRPAGTSATDNLARWWNWLGLDIDLGGLVSNLYLGIIGGAVLFAVGVIIALVRR